MELLEGVDLETLVRRNGPLPAERAMSARCGRSATRSARRTRGASSTATSSRRTSRLHGWAEVRLRQGARLRPGQDRLERSDEASELVTVARRHVGTPAYMPPSWRSARATSTHRADLYALGCVAYWLLTGRLVFEADTPVKMMLLHVQAETDPSLARDRDRGARGTRPDRPRVPGEAAARPARLHARGRAQARRDRGRRRMDEGAGRGVVGSAPPGGGAGERPARVDSGRDRARGRGGAARPPRAPRRAGRPARARGGS